LQQLAFHGAVSSSAREGEDISALVGRERKKRHLRRIEITRMGTAVISDSGDRGLTIKVVV
jgi:hypothetical protein